MPKKLIKKALTKKKVVPVKKEVLPVVEKVEKEKVREDKKYSLTVGLKDLFDAGCHLGHKVSKTHPKARKNIFISKDGIEVFDLAKTMEALEKACNFIYNAKRNGKSICLVGTKRQAKEVVKRIALSAGVPYVTDRWLGGTITNWEQIKKIIKKLKDYKDGIEKNKFAENTKKEQLMIRKEIMRMERIVGGLSVADKLFDIIFVVDAGMERTAIKEAKLRKITTIAITDSDTNPDKVDYAISANDDNVKSVTILVEEIGKAIKSA